MPKHSVGFCRLSSRVDNLSALKPMDKEYTSTPPPCEEEKSLAFAPQPSAVKKEIQTWHLKKTVYQVWFWSKFKIFKAKYCFEHFTFGYSTYTADLQSKIWFNHFLLILKCFYF